MGTVIDSLVVTLGLDASGYKKGRADAEAAQKSLKESALSEAKATEDAGKKSGQVVNRLGRKRKVESIEERKRRLQAEKDQRRGHDLEKRFTEGTISRLKNLGLALGGAVLGFKTLEGAVQAYAETSNNLANLGRLAPTVATSAKDINVLGSALKQVGGSQADANADIMRVAAAQFSLQMHRPDQFAAMARNMGVGLFNKQGGLRSKVDVLTDIGKRLRQMTPDVQAQAMYARQMGLSEASIQLFVVDQAKVRRQILNDAVRTNAVDKQNTQNAIDQAQQFARLGNRVQAVKQRIVGALAGDAATTIKTDLDPNKSFGQKLMATLIGLTGGYSSQALNNEIKYIPALTAAEKKYGLPAGLLTSVARQESTFNPNAVNKKSGARGLMQLNPRFFPNAGKNVNSDIDSAAKELKRLYGVYGNWKDALRAYNDGQGNYDKYRHGVIKRLPAETRAYAPDVLGRMPAASAAAAMVSGATAAPARPSAAATASGPPTASNTTVHIDNIHLPNVQNADQFARDLPQSLRRKGVVSSANTGLT